MSTAVVTSFSGSLTSHETIKDVILNTLHTALNKTFEEKDDFTGIAVWFSGVSFTVALGVDVNSIGEKTLVIKDKEVFLKAMQKLINEIGDYFRPSTTEEKATRLISNYSKISIHTSGEQNEDGDTIYFVRLSGVSYEERKRIADIRMESELQVKRLRDRMDSDLRCAFKNDLQTCIMAQGDVCFSHFHTTITIDVDSSWKTKTYETMLSDVEKDVRKLVEEDKLTLHHVWIDIRDHRSCPYITTVRMNAHISASNQSMIVAQKKAAGIII